MSFGAGVQAQSEKGSGSQSGSGEGTSTSMPVIPQEWLDAAKRGSEAIDSGGMSPEQRQAADYFSGRMAPSDNTVADRFLDAGVNRNAYTTRALVDEYGYADPRAVAGQSTAGQAWADSSTAGQGAAAQGQAMGSVAGTSVGGVGTAARGVGYVAPYESRYEDRVVQSTLDQLKRSQAEGRNDLRSQYGGTRSASGGEATGREQVSAGQMASDNILDQAQIVSALRGQGFDKSVAAGLTDAGRQTDISGQNAALGTQAGIASAANVTQSNIDNARLGSDMIQFNAAALTDTSNLNAGLRTQAAMDNARLRTQAEIQNAGLTTASSRDNAALRSEASQLNAEIAQRQLEFDSKTAYGRDTDALTAAQEYIKTLSSQGEARDKAAAALSELGQGGFDNILDALGLGTSTFGQKDDATYESRGESTYKSSGMGAQAKASTPGSK